MIDSAKKEKLGHLIETIAQKDVLLAFSGGADSALVLALLAQAVSHSEARLRAVYLKTSLMPKRDESEARYLANQLGVPFDVIQINEWDEPLIVQNGTDRCYHCKKLLFTTLKSVAQLDGFSCVVDGTNHDDLQSFRPGLRALSELGIMSPLAMVGVCKQEVRSYLAELGLTVSTRPSSPCLATRVPYGTKLEAANLLRIEKAESLLREMNFYNVRLRLHDELVRIEVDLCDLQRVLQHRDMLVKQIKSLGFRYVTLDLEGFRSGSFDEK